MSTSSEISRQRDRLSTLSPVQPHDNRKAEEVKTLFLLVYHRLLSNQRLHAMKTLAFSVPALLATLAYTSVVAAAEAPATVYFFSHGRPSTSSIVNNNNNRPSLNLKETRAALAHLLNLGQGHNRNRDESFIDMRGPIQQVFSQPGMARKDLFETPGGNLMMVIEGVQHPHG